MTRFAKVNRRAGKGDLTRANDDEEGSMRTAEIVFEVTKSDEGGYKARARSRSIFTQGDDWNDLKAMVRDAVLCHFGEGSAPRAIRLHLIREEAIAV